MKKPPEQTQPTQPLADAESINRLLTVNARELISRHTSDLTFLYASPAAGRVLGYAAEQLLGQRLDDLVHPDDLAGVVTAFALARDGEDTVAATMRVQAADGSWRWCEAFCRGVESEETGELEIHAAIHDISKFKQIEKAIERVAREWRSTFDAARDAILMLDRQARIIRVNLATTRVLNCDFAELLGQPLRQVIHDRLDLDDPFGVDQVWQQRGQVRRDVQLEGSGRWLRSTIDPVAGTGGEMTGAIVFLADISTEKQAEVRLRDTLEQLRRLSSHLQVVREEERKSIAREVHDELGHAMTALKMEIAWLGRQLDDSEPDLKKHIGSMTSLVDQTISTVRRISSELRPPVLDDLGLDAAIEWLAEDFKARTSLPVSVRLPDPVDNIRGKRAISSYRIVQEALTNAARYAEAGAVEIDWHQDETNIRLEIRDNGKGFDADARRPCGGFGLLGMEERARDLDGELVVATRMGEGTLIRLTFPRSPAV
ncbi:MAG: PAS domain S-box protein [Xanthomonadaceae bacterium]|nr:PAS domain S-box protein [Xanthomonadaceae bacterium]